MIFVAVNEAGVVVARSKLLGQLRADFKQSVVRDLLGVAVVRIEVVARVVVLATTFVLEFLPRQIPRLGHLVLAIKAKVVRPSDALVVALFVDLEAEVFDARGGRWTRRKFQNAHGGSSPLRTPEPVPVISRT